KASTGPRGWIISWGGGPQEKTSELSTNGTARDASGNARSWHRSCSSSVRALTRHSGGAHREAISRIGRRIARRRSLAYGLPRHGMDRPIVQAAANGRG